MPLHRAGHALLSDKPVAAFELWQEGVIAPFDLQVRPRRDRRSGRTARIRTHGNCRGYFRHQTGRQRHPRGSKVKRGGLRSPHAGVKAGHQLCPRIVKPTGLLPRHRCGENIVTALQAQRGWLRPIPRREQNEALPIALSASSVFNPSARQPIEFLSGGNPGEGAAFPLAADQTAVP